MNRGGAAHRRVRQNSRNADVNRDVNRGRGGEYFFAIARNFSSTQVALAKAKVRVFLNKDIYKPAHPHDLDPVSASHFRNNILHMHMLHMYMYQPEHGRTHYTGCGSSKGTAVRKEVPTTAPMNSGRSSWWWISDTLRRLRCAASKRSRGMAYRSRSQPSFVAV